jgi:hypothetical protein
MRSLSTSESIDVVIYTQQLGLHLTTVRSAGEIFVEAVTNEKYNDTIFPGDVMVSMGNIGPLKTKSMEDVSSYIISSKRPTIVRFKRPHQVTALAAPTPIAPGISQPHHHDVLLDINGIDRSYHMYSGNVSFSYYIAARKSENNDETIWDKVKSQDPPGRFLQISTYNQIMVVRDKEGINIDND